jgi:hypothetical protein
MVASYHAPMQNPCHEQLKLNGKLSDSPDSSGGSPGISNAYIGSFETEP